MSTYELEEKQSKSNDILAEIRKENREKFIVGSIFGSVIGLASAGLKYFATIHQESVADVVYDFGAATIIFGSTLFQSAFIDYYIAKDFKRNKSYKAAKSFIKMHAEQ